MGTPNAVARLTQTWASPAFLKRKASELQPLLGTVYDPFEYKHEYREFSPSKKTKFSRKSEEWRFTDRSPSPVVTPNPAYDESLDDLLKSPISSTETDKPVTLHPTLQQNVNFMPRQKSPGATSATFHDSFQRAESAELDVSGKRSPREAEDRDGKSNASLVGSSSPEPDNILEMRKPAAIIQDTYDDETWSSPGTTADPNMETTTSDLDSKEPRPPDTSSLSPKQVSQSPVKISKSGHPSTDRRHESEDDASLQDENMDSDGSVIEESIEEPFSKRAYVPSESVASSVISSEEHEMNGIRSSNLTEGEHNNEPNYMISRPQSSNANITTKGLDSESQPSVLIDKVTAHQPVDDTVTATQRKSPPKAYGLVGQIKDVMPTSVEDKRGFAQGQEERSDRDTSDPLGTSRDHKMAGRILEEETRQSSPSGPLLNDQTINGLPHNVAGEDEGDDDDDDDEDKMHGSETWTSKQRTESAGLLNKELVGHDQEIAEDPTIERYSMADTKQVSSEDESGSDDVEIIDLDEYKPKIGDEEDGDLAQSEDGDYWSQEEPPRSEDEESDEPDHEHDDQSEEGARSDVEEDDEISEEEEIRLTNREPGETMDDEESNLHDHSPVAPNKMQEVRGNLNSRPESKISTVEIIDLESEEEDEPATTAGDIIKASPTWFDGPITDEAPREASSPSIDHRKHTHVTEISKQVKAIKLDIGVETIGERRIKPFPKSTTPLERVVHDTYSEDAALSDAENSEAPSITPANAAMHPLAWSIKQLPDFEASAGIPAISPNQSTFSGQRDTPVEDSQNIPHGEDPASPVHSPIDRDERPSREMRGEIEQVEGLTQLSPEFPAQDESPASPSASLVAQIKTTTLSHDQTSGSSVSAEDDEFPRDQKTLRTYGDGTDEEVIKEYSLEALRDEFTQQSQLPTPNDTQTYKIFHEPSPPQSISHEEQHTLPTPSLTQRTSELVPPATPALPRKLSLIEKLKEMRSHSARKRQANLANDITTAASPWFGISRSSQIAPSSDQESIAGVDEATGRDGDISSDVEQSEVDSQPSLPRRRAESPLLDPGIARLPSSSPPPPPPEPKAGFRTSLSYFAPLSTLRSHYNATTSVLALVIASTAVARATAGPKDYHMTLHITDPSSASPPSVTSARIFRPSKFPFPEARQGDAILLRNFRVVSYRKQLGLLSTESSAWAVFRRGEEPQIRGPPVEFGAEERGFARGHWDWWGTVVQQDFIDAIPSGTSEKKGRDLGRGKGRSSLVRHELRDGTTYIDRPKVADNDMHELRDGTIWSDSKP